MTKRVNFKDLEIGKMYEYNNAVMYEFIDYRNDDIAIFNDYDEEGNRIDDPIYLTKSEVNYYLREYI